MEYQDETVFVNYEKLDQRQNRDGRREPVESRQDCPAPGELDQAYMKLGKAHEGGFEEPLPILPLFDRLRDWKAENRQRNPGCPNCG
ncbi:MAG: zinc ribbon domain-containing protein [Lachnospiraceae bacterium]